jgi:urease accessory protein UreE
MLIVNKLIPQGRGLAPVLLKRAASVELDWDVRCKSRFDATDSQGRTLGVFLPRGTPVRGGDVLVAEDGSLIRVHAAPQPVLVVRHCSEHGSPFDLLRAAYHLGNRHVRWNWPDHLKLEPDHVLADMLRCDAPDRQRGTGRVRARGRRLWRRWGDAGHMGMGMNMIMPTTWARTRWPAARRQPSCTAPGTITTRPRPRS